jgi:hypothetical protein
MKVIGKNIGTALDEMYASLEQRVRVEAERALRVEPFEAGAFSTVEWEPDAVVIMLHNGVPTRALPHVFGVALQHVRQRLDLYPIVAAPAGAQPPDSEIVRSVLRELVMAPEAELHLQGLGLDVDWETKQRHAGLKEMLRDADPAWDEAGTLGNAFAALQYAQFALTHPADLWTSLQQQMRERLPAAAERGEGVVQVVREHGWGSPGACRESLVAARDELALQPIALIQDLRSGEFF